MAHSVSRCQNILQRFRTFKKVIGGNRFLSLKHDNDCLIETEELHSLIGSGKKYLLFDTSAYNIKSNQTEEIIQEYGNIEKIKGTINFDSEIVKHENPNLCHLFPTEEEFFSYLKNLLILNEVNIDSLDNIPIILYEKNDIFFAPRIWFLFKLFAFQNLKILNGGLNKWMSENKEVVQHNCNYNCNNSRNDQERIKKIEETIDKYLRKNKDVIANNLKKNIYHYADIKKLIESKKDKKMNHFIIVDTRPNESYSAMIKIPEKENKEKLVSNCLPFSTNIPYTKFLRFFDPTVDNEGKEEAKLFKYVTFKDITELKNLMDRYNLLRKDNIIISICNKGFTASTLLFVLHMLKKPFPSLILYPGSMVEYKMFEYSI